MQALALKYRPKNYNELIGQNTIAKSLSHALDSNRLSHAYLFSGLRGSGKTSSARIFAKALLCDNGPTSNPCEKCSNCIMANEGRHIDIIEMDAASHRKIDDIRELIEQTKYSPASARFKIFIIDEVHMLTKEASNALLKTLEEPPSYIKFILATTDPLKLPATVLSRTQHFRFQPIVKSAIVSHLKYILENENIKYEESALEILSRSGSGSLRDTLTLLDQAIIFSGENVTANAVADMLGLLEPTKINEILQIVLRQDRDGAIEIIKEIENYNIETIIDEIIANLREKFINKDKSFSPLIYERFFRILSETKGLLSVSTDNTFTLSMALFMMMEAVNLRDIDELIEVSKMQIKDQKQETISNLQNSSNLQTQNETNLQISKTTNQTSNLQNSQIYKFNDFIDKLYDRNYELGEKFKNFTEFVKFEENNLFLKFNIPSDERKFLASNWKIIISIFKNLFGENADIINIDKVEKKNNEVKNEITNISNDMKKSMDKFMNYSNSEKPQSNFNAIEEIKKLKSGETVSDEEKIKKELERLFGKPKQI